jgi:hypothetical protein
VCSCKADCPEVMCRMYCEHGWAVNKTTGCEMCACHECEPLSCRMDCEHGLAQDERGCDMCQCRDTPTAPAPAPVPSRTNGCPGVMCAMWCENGFEVDPDTGCEVCSCKADCPEVMCRMYCEHGWAVNETTGCEMCACHECEPLPCRMDCEHGLAQDERGCDMCQCRDTPAAPAPSPDKAPCPGVMCDMWCEHGFAVNAETGCEDCVCHECGPLCDMYCEHGNAVDERGCEKCQCLVAGEENTTTTTKAEEEEECAPVMCKIACPNGWAVDPDTGCEFCGCHECPPTCDRSCEHGNVIDDHGCQLCECLSAPAETTTTTTTTTTAAAAGGGGGGGGDKDNDDGAPCPAALCLMEAACKHGFAVDANTGCELCQCHECGPVCEMYCLHGHVLDARGCETCPCRDGPDASRPPCPTDRSAGDDELVVTLCDGTAATTAVAAVGVVATAWALL